MIGAIIFLGFICAMLVAVVSNCEQNIKQLERRIRQLEAK